MEARFGLSMPKNPICFTILMDLRFRIFWVPNLSCLSLLQEGTQLPSSRHSAVDIIAPELDGSRCLYVDAVMNVDITVINISAISGMASRT